MTASPLAGSGVQVAAFDEIDSTSAEAMRRIVTGETGPLWITAARQTAGKGRSGRSWSSPTGNFSGSFLFQPGCPPQHLAQLAFVAGLAVHDTVAVLLNGRRRTASDPGTGPEGPRLKWPNDVLIDGAKLAGILVEATNRGQVQFAVIGIGVNLLHAPEVPGRATVALADAGVAVTPAAFLPQLARCLERRLHHWDRGAGFASIRADWLARGPALGDSITVHRGTDTVSGMFSGLGEDGALLLTTPDGNVVGLTYGDILP